MSVVHVDFMRSRSIVSSALDYAIDYQTGTLSMCYPDERSAWNAIDKQWSRVSDKLTFKQYQRVTTDSKGYAVRDYKTKFERVLKVSKDRLIVSLATKALEDIASIEAQFPAQISATN